MGWTTLLLFLGSDILTRLGLAGAEYIFGDSLSKEDKVKLKYALAEKAEQAKANQAIVESDERKTQQANEIMLRMAKMNEQSKGLQAEGDLMLQRAATDQKAISAGTLANVIGQAPSSGGDFTAMASQPVNMADVTGFY